MFQGAFMALQDILEQAINFEKEAYDFYTTALGLVESEQAKTILRELADEEASHQAKLTEIRDSGLTWAAPIDNPEDRVDLKIGEHLMPAQLDETSDFQDALMVAIKREQASYDFYTSMAQIVCPESQQVFQFLADEEAKHKNNVQEIYDQIVYQDN